ncbi:hypothetical protein DC366_08635 [Pelagivirga sediminicola]|uniref:Uncharacterized protein n=1 Tax=Pelagivirga sediminicola TaxID=2170575 RepID=A0A2T7G797_9RHOB|nr:hypothetical protein [Pelagivirga sediminicola]PVA10301.1 hypothetical protein DC366_08635 [Pelagivirga sediminicola]
MSDAAQLVQAARDGLAKLKALKGIIRDAPDKVRRDAAIIAYSRTLDVLVENLNALEDMGVLAGCVARMRAAANAPDRPQG